MVDPVITIAAAMSVQWPFTRVASNNSNSDILKVSCSIKRLLLSGHIKYTYTERSALQNRRIFDSHHGDPFILLNLWQGWLEAKADRKVIVLDSRLIGFFHATNGLDRCHLETGVENMAWKSNDYTRFVHVD